MVFLVELSVMNKTQMSSHYVLMRADNEDTACILAQKLYEKKQTNAGDIIMTLAEPFYEDDDYLIIC